MIWTISSDYTFEGIVSADLSQFVCLYKLPSVLYLPSTSPDIGSNYGTITINVESEGCKHNADIESGKSTCRPIYMAFLS